MYIVVNVIMEQPFQGFLSKEPVITAICHATPASVISLKERRDQHDPAGQANGVSEQKQLAGSLLSGQLALVEALTWTPQDPCCNRYFRVNS